MSTMSTTTTTIVKITTKGGKRFGISNGISFKCVIKNEKKKGKMTLLNNIFHGGN